MTGLRVMACAAGASIQDMGRFGMRRFGVSTSGAMDGMALAHANVLAGNPAGTAAIELTFAGAAFQVEGGRLLVAVGGPGATLEIAGRPVAPHRSAIAMPSDTVKVGPVVGGVYGYLAVAGGICTPPHLGSRSLHLRSGIGGRPIQTGDHLPCKPVDERASERALPEPPAPSSEPLRIVPGPQEAHFIADAMTTFVSSTYRVDPKSDRMAIRLDGPGLAHAGDFNIVSDGVVPGSIQVPGDGQPLILMRDCQTTGGYPKIATVISADLDRLAQSAPGSALRFRVVTMAEAIAAARVAEDQRKALQASTFAAPRTPTSEQLLAHNLIDGVVHGLAPNMTEKQ